MPLIPQQQPPYYSISDGNTTGAKIYTALLNQSGTDAPTAIEFINEIGAIVWTRSMTGTYNATLSGAFPENKVWLTITNNNGSSYQFIIYNNNDGDTIEIQTKGLTAGALPYITYDDQLIDTPVHITVYP